MKPFRIIIRGGGDLGSGVAYRLFQCGWQILITEIPQPLVLRRSVAFANAVYEKECTVEGVQAQLCLTSNEIKAINNNKKIAVLVDPENDILKREKFDVCVDARMLKTYQPNILSSNCLMIGLGPGFIAGENCHSVIETKRGHFLGRVIRTGSPQPDTGIPGNVENFTNERVLRSPTRGTILSEAKLGDVFKQGETIAKIGGEELLAPFDGCLRGLMHNDIFVEQCEKVGDLDPRLEPSLIHFISEKALAIAGGVLEAILSYYHEQKT
ncbi:MAG: molybdenum hydroxylase [Chloroflexi bacterium HGW-Chloroflexi-10]|nr:MAG: molybdenum hydroxylase [Chloroflexi bacterium HGW-Chloroflexi-10]